MEVSRWQYFKVITVPKIVWYLGGGLVDNIRSYWHLRVKKLPPLWPDVSQDGCERIYCRFCGKSPSRES
jgi:hypothetical protein